MFCINKIFHFILIAIFITSLTSCITSPVCITSSTTPLNNTAKIENLGKTEGSDSAWSLFGLWMFGKPNIDTAIKEAVQKRDGNALIYVRCYETISYYILFSITTVTVEGEAIKLSVAGAENVR
ncbi:MAG: hypothetical protein SVZ03_04020 [Spirochaetota bacterium]|nr:hypothetical protein [Spirochaetota bacterium]